MNDLNFASLLEERDIDSKENLNVVECKISWGVEFEVRAWGIKDIYPLVKAVHIVYLNDDGEILDKYFYGFDVKINVSSMESFRLYPVNIYFDNDVCEVTF